MTVGGNLPVEVTAFVGRRRELSEVKRLLSTSRLVTLTGIGGVGKTRLALRAAADLHRAFRGGVYLVELADLTDAALLEHTVGAVLGLRERASEGQTAALVDYLASRQLLLVLDNCEHLVDGCARLADQLLRTCPGLRILATSRQPLAIRGESVVPVPPMAVPESDRTLHPNAVGDYDAVNLLLDRARASVPTFTLTEQNCASVASLCHELEGIPLALELAAVRLRSLSPAEILDRLSRRHGLLTQGDRTAPSRQQTLRASLDWSFDLCSLQEQELWARLSVFTGGFELDAAEDVCSEDQLLPRDQVLDVVASLVDKSVLLREEHGPHLRYRMLETVRQYGQERLEQRGDPEIWRRRHRDGYADLVARAEADWISPRQAAWLARLRREHANLRTALEFSAADRDQPAIGMRIAVALEHYWTARGELSEGRHWLNRMLSYGTGPDIERARALRLDAWLALLQNDMEDAGHLLKEAHRLADGDKVAQAYVLQTSGVLAAFQGDLGTAVRHLKGALPAFRNAGHRIGEIHTLVLLGMSLGWAGDTDTAAAAHRECLALTESAGELDYRSDSLWALGVDAWRKGDYDQATQLQKASLRLKRQLDERLGIANSIEALAWLATTAADAERAPLLLGAAETLYQTMGMSLADIAHLSTYHAQAEAAARQRLPDRAFHAAFQRGQSLSVEEAIAFALEEKAPARGPTAPNETTSLTRRERQVAELLAEGLTNKEIAARLVISIRTAETHVEHILTKLGFTSRAQVAAWVTQQRIYQNHAPPELSES